MKNGFLVLLCSCSLIFLKLFPHAPNFTPIFSFLILATFYGANRTLVAITTVATLAACDTLLNFQLGYPLWGTWMLFSYSGYLLIIFSANRIQLSDMKSNLILSTGLHTLGFWLWTNFGVWLTSGIYPISQNGFIACYIMALPFLGASALCNLLGTSLYILGHHLFIFFPSRAKQHST